MVKDLPPSIESDDEEPVSSCSEDENETPDGGKRYFSSDFEFTCSLDDYQADPWKDIGQYLKKKRLSSLDDNISRIREQNAASATNGEAHSSDEEDEQSGGPAEENDENGELSDEVRVNADELRRKKKKEQRLVSKQEEEEQKSGEFFTEITGENVKAVKTFHEMNLSRPLLKALGDMQLLHPTPIQKCTVPVALLGRDICACAATGTGKTAAFLLPTLERLVCSAGAGASGGGGRGLGGSGGVATGTRVLVLVPTRELGAQVFVVARQLSQHIAGMQVALVAGGMDVKVQEAQLRRHPDIVIATPGRLIDHLQNTHGFCLDTVEVLILDEADRMLDEYFAEQMTEIIRQCSLCRQTMLFSATMTDDVKQLAAASLKDPVKIFVNENTDVAARLKQEFVRIRQDRDGDREAVLAALLMRTFRERVMVFVQTKRQTHRLHILLGLLGVKVGELHGGLTQAQRLNSLRCFKENSFDVLLATDVAARGLDIPDVKTVINLTMPATIKQYVHRVGRTARAGRSGRSVSLVGPDERSMLRQLGRRSVLPLQARVVPNAVIERVRQRIQQLQSQVESVCRLEREQRELRIAESQMSRAERRIAAGDGPKATHSPSSGGQHHASEEQPRSWFLNRPGSGSKTTARSSQLRAGNNPQKKGDNKKKKKSGAQQQAHKDEMKRQLLHAKAHKKACRQGGAHTVANKSSKQKSGRARKGRLNLTSELTDTSHKAVKGFRHRATESIRERKLLKSGKAKDLKKLAKRKR